jgi:hypothetical protein
VITGLESRKLWEKTFWARLDDARSSGGIETPAPGGHALRLPLVEGLDEGGEARAVFIIAACAGRK